MKMIARIEPVAEQKTASEALVLPVLAQAARRAPTIEACVKAAVMPLSLKLPDGFRPSYWRNNRPDSSPTKAPTVSARCKIVCPSPMVNTFSTGANGSSSRNLQTPLKFRALVRLAHLFSNERSEGGGASRLQS